MGERAAQVDATRERILEAAIGLYTELGISATTLREIGNRADVAPGTLRNHFPTRDLLDAAIVERLQAEAPLPELAIFDGAASIEERLRRLIGAAGAFTDQAARMYRMWLREPMLSGPWARAGADYGARWDLLMRTALGPLAGDPEAMAILRAVLQPTFFGSIGGGMKSTEDIADLIADLVAPWFVTRSEASEQRRH
jgi:AcrR family transcriptional regulator